MTRTDRVAKRQTKPSRILVCIEGVEYDMTGYIHPGGSVIEYASGQGDATEWFREFHSHSKKARTVLANWPASRKRRIENQSGKESIREDFDLFRTELLRAGFFRPSLFHATWRLIDLGIWFLAGLILYKHHQFTMATFAHGVFGMRCGWVQHECGHDSFFCNKKWNRVWQTIVMGFGLGTSGSLWNSMHNKHHAAPQKVGHDVDLDTAPLVAFYKEAFESKRMVRLRAHTRAIWAQLVANQAYTFVPITSGLFVTLFWVGYLHPRHAFRKGRLDEMVAMGGSHIVRTWLVRWLTNIRWWQSYIIGFWLPMCIAGSLLFGHFATSHTHTPIVAADERREWHEYALGHSVDIAPQSRVVSYIMGHLNKQVVHHLYPSMPQFRQGEVSRRLQIFCAKRGIRYTILSYTEAVTITFRHLHETGKYVAARYKLFDGDISQSQGLVSSVSPTDPLPDKVPLASVSSSVSLSVSSSDEA